MIDFQFLGGKNKIFPKPDLVRQFVLDFPSTEINYQELWFAPAIRVAVLDSRIHPSLADVCYFFFRVS
jgi:hypothetical protein